MIKICRLTLALAHTKLAEGETMEDRLNSALAKAGVKREEIEVHYNEAYENNTHFGNWVLTPVLDNEATAKVAAALGTEVGNRRSIIELADICKFKFQDKVRVSFTSELGFAVNEEGKVLDVDFQRGNIRILKKGSRKNGWAFPVGYQVTIEKIA
jgi:hypothetical protein